MGNKIIILLYTVVFLISGLLYAQESLPESQPGYYVDRSEGEPVFKQRLVWDKDEYVLYYEVAIQIFSGQYRDYRIEKTKNNYIEISLNPGKYRYSVTPYDLLERRCDSSDWEEFSISTAFKPEIYKFVPDFFYMEQNKKRILLVSGNNIFDDSVIYLRNDTNELVPIEKVVTGNSSVTLTFDDDTLIPGNYEVYIKNPGGLDASLGVFFVGYHKTLEVFLKVGFNPVIPAGGELMNIFGPYLYYPGVTFRLESLASERASFKAGMEFALSFYYLHSNLSIRPIESILYNIYNAYSDASVSLIDFAINIPMQVRFNHLKNAVTFSFGFGFTSFTSYGYIYDYYDDYYYDYADYGYDYDYNRKKYDKNGVNTYVNLSISGLFLVYEFFYFETGMDFTFYFEGKSVLLKPRISAVFKI